jgi:hypothetical protein
MPTQLIVLQMVAERRWSNRNNPSGPDWTATYADIVEYAGMSLRVVQMAFHNRYFAPQQPEASARQPPAPRGFGRFPDSRHDAGILLTTFYCSTALAGSSRRAQTDYPLVIVHSRTVLTSLGLARTD